MTTKKNTTRTSKKANNAKTPAKAKPATKPAKVTPEVQTPAPDSSVPSTPTPVPTDATTPTTDATKPAKAKATKEAKPKRVSALEAAAQVLATAGKPLNAQELVTAMKEQQLWESPTGKTPHATLHAAISTEIKKKGKDSRFRKAERGHFTLA